MSASLQVLVVEPDPESAATVSDVVQALGHRVLAVSSAEEALDLDGFAADVVVSEIRLPGISGLDLLEAFEARGSRPAAVFTSALPNHHDCRRAFRMGAVDLLAKPIDAALVRAAIEDAPSHASHAPRSDESLVLELEATETVTDLAVREVLAFALRVGVPPAARARLAGALAEILENVREHAYDSTGVADRPVHVRASLVDSELEVQVQDEGRGFDTARARLDATPSALPDDDSTPGGLARVASLVEGMTLSSSDRGTRVTLRVCARGATFANDTTDLSELDYLEPRRAKQILRAVHSGRTGDMSNIPPALAVVLGRLLAGPTPSQAAQTSLW